MKFALGTKKEMTSIYDDSGKAFPVTAVLIGPMVILDIKNEERDGYSSVQVGFGSRKKEKTSKALRGHIDRSGHKGESDFSRIMEFRVSQDQMGEFKIGDTITPGDVFESGDLVEVTGISKGKGFQGVVKRHGFAGGPRTHGQKHSERSPGSIGATGPQRVLKGVRMAGRMGGDRVNVKNLKVVNLDKENSLMYIGGALPGRKGTLLEIRQVV